MSGLSKIVETIEKCAKENNREPSSIQLLAATKHQPSRSIIPLLEDGHRLFGENRVQEAYQKWPGLKQKYSDIKLHLIGHLQSNKARDAVALFDVIQTLDNFKLAEKLDSEEARQNKKLEYFIEINIGKEPQKCGIWPEDFPIFFEKLRKCFSLTISGVMCIPPKDQNPRPYFQQMQAIANNNQLSYLSMGMSDDYKLAIEYGATMVRIGRALF